MPLTCLEHSEENILRSTAGVFNVYCGPRFQCNGGMQREAVYGKNMQLPTCHSQMCAALGLSCRVNYSALVYTPLILLNFQ